MIKLPIQRLIIWMLVGYFNPVYPVYSTFIEALRFTGFTGSFTRPPFPSPIAKLDTRHINRGPRKGSSEAKTSVRHPLSVNGKSVK